MIKISAKDLKPKDIIIDARSKAKSMVKSTTFVDDKCVKVAFYGKLAVYHGINEMLQITAAPATMKHGAKR
jgi:hypothetical protein